MTCSVRIQGQENKLYPLDESSGTLAGTRWQAYLSQGSQAVCDIPDPMSLQIGQIEVQRRDLWDGMVHFPGEEADYIAKIPVSAEGVGDSGRDSGFAQSLGRFPAKLSVTNIPLSVTITLHI